MHGVTQILAYVMSTFYCTVIWRPLHLNLLILTDLSALCKVFYSIDIKTLDVINRNTIVFFLCTKLVFAMFSN